MLFRPVILDYQETLILDRIDQLKRELAFTISPRRWYGLLRRNSLARNLQGSNSIEGLNITVDDAIAAMEGEEPLDPKTESFLANVCYCRAMTFVIQKSNAPYFEYSNELINSLHYMIAEYDMTKHPGNWRSGPIFVKNERTGELVYEGADIETIPSLMHELIASLNLREESSHPIIRAAMAHLNLVLIHPFSDGNGRTARCLQTLVLARGGTIKPEFVSIEEYLGRNTEDYYSVLREVGGGHWLPERDARPWIRFCLTAHFRQATTLLRRSRFLQQLFEELERVAITYRLPERTVFAMVDAAWGRKIRNAMYRNIVDVSQKAATRDLQQLVDTGFLEAKGKKRGSYYVAAAKLLEATNKVPRPVRVEDPFKVLDMERVLPGMEELILAQ
ncbi:MAG TPA: Fic family protein [Thermoanaerobaculia bacterium]|nr:Fic family protein [Thermoanaerobaculia bacterium]